MAGRGAMSMMGWGTSMWVLVKSNARPEKAEGESYELWPARMVQAKVHVTRLEERPCSIRCSIHAFVQSVNCSRFVCTFASAMLTHSVACSLVCFLCIPFMHLFLCLIDVCFSQKCFMFRPEWLSAQAGCSHSRHLA